MRYQRFGHLFVLRLDGVDEVYGVQNYTEGAVTKVCTWPNSSWIDFFYYLGVGSLRRKDLSVASI